MGAPEARFRDLEHPIASKYVIEKHANTQALFTSTSFDSFESLFIDQLLDIQHAAWRIA